MPLFNFFANDIGANLGKAMSSTSLWTNIAKTIIFILLGFIFTKKKLLLDSTGKVLTKFVMSVCLPCLAFCSFMTAFTVQGAIDAVVNFVLGFILYIAFIFIGKLMFLWVKDDEKRLVLAVLFAFGSTTFFGYPIVTAVYGKAAGNDFNIMNVAYRVFLYSYAYVAIANYTKKDVTTAESLSDAKAAEGKEAAPKQEKASTSFGALMKKVFLNPIVIATLAGLLLWVLQAIPGVAIVRTDWLKPNASVAYADAAKVAFWRFDVTLPWIFSAANTLGGLSSTIILFAIGCTLGGTNIKEAAEDKYAWIWTVLKVFVAPLIVLVLLFAVEAIAKAANFPQLISMDTVNSTIITWMVPPATVAVGYCINYDRQKEMASHISLISTFGAVIGVIIWVILLTVISSTGFFYVAA